MTTLLAFNEYTGWGINQNNEDIIVSTSLSTKRDHTRISYGLLSTTEFTRELTEPVSQGWLGVYAIPPQSFGSDVAGYFLEAIDINGDTLFGLARDSDPRNCVLRAPFLSEDIMLLPYNGDAGEIAISFNIAGTGGSINAFVDGEIVGQFTGDTKGGLVADVVALRYSRNGTNSSNINGHIAISEVLVSTLSTIEFKVITAALSGGAVNQWDGDVANITPHGYSTVEDGLSTENADTLISLDKSDIPTLDVDEFIASVHLEVASSADAGATAQAADLLIYDPATSTELSPERKTLGATAATFTAQWDEDPRTSSAWDKAGVDEIEFGVASRAA